MSVDYYARSGLVSGTTSVTISAASIPGIAAGNLLVAIAATNHATDDTAVPTCDGGGTWTQLFTYVSTGGGTQGAGTGNRRVTAWYRERAASESTDVTFSLTGGNVMLCFITAFTKTTAGPWSLAYTNGEDTTSGTAVSITGAAGIDILTSDLVYCGWASPTSTTYSTHDLTATGLTWTTLTEQADSGTTTGNDIRLVAITADGITSPSNAVPTVTSTGTAATTQAGYFIRISDRSVGIAVGTATETDAAQAITRSFPNYLFEPPTYQQLLEPPLLIPDRPRISLTESTSIVRIGGVLTAMKSPSQDHFVGTEGIDYFRGGRVYTVSFNTATELRNAGFTDLTML